MNQRGSGLLRQRLPSIAAVALTIAIFLADLHEPRPTSLGALYVLAVLVASISERRIPVAAAALGSAVLTAITFGFRVAAGQTMHAVTMSLVGLIALAVATIIVLRRIGVSSLASSQARLLDETHDSVMVRALDGKISYWNRASSAIYGWSREEAIGTTLDELFNASPGPESERIVERVLETGGWERELAHRTKDGREIVVESRLALIRDDRGRPSAILETAKDVTHRKRADEELRFKEARYHGMFQTMGVAYWEMDFSRARARCAELWKEGVRDFAAYIRENPGFVRECIELSRPRDVNAASVRLFGAESPEHLMNNFSKCWPPEGEPVFAGAMLAALRNAPTFETDAVLRGVDGRVLEVLFTVSYPPGSEARDSIVVALVDLAESNRAKAELRAAQDDLAHAMRLSSLGVLTATIAHEVNQPLGGVIANGRAGLRWLRREQPALDEVANSIEQALSEAKRAASVLSRIRAIARKTEPEPVALDLNELIDETMALLAGELRAARVELQLRLLRPSPMVVADRIQLQQVLINLALNSVHALSAIEGRARILTIGSAAETTMAVISVDDSGHGIDPELAGNLFTPFFTTKTEGLGVGLSVCGDIIERHGGRISVVGKDTPGFCVQFTLPLASHALPATTAATARG